MTQQQIINIFKKNPEKWFSLKEIQKKTKLNQSASRNLRSMVKYNEIRMKPEKVKNTWRHLYKINSQGEKSNESSR